LRTLAIVPVKTFAAAKQRLADALARGSRASLAQAMFSDVLVALKRTGSISETVVVTADSGAQRIAGGYGATVLDDDDRPVDEGEAGEVVATTFGVEAMPLIRYRTGDCAALFRAPCVCGRATPRLGPIVGRKNQKLKLKGTSLFPSTLQAVLERAEGVEAFVIIARAENELFDSVEVLVHGAAPVASLREALQARSKIAPQIRQASRAEIEALQMPPQARKRRTFVDLR